ncbi:hypothetical protein A9K72_31730 [Mesorhizobium loti]|nr:hypothetical protein A9174_31790 [Mesorhizobium loti NZP2037]OBP79963.1 hypothetical protein BAE41_29385 [Mesorhizobium loti]OBP96390.1 hypothetical protein BAE38_29435 [Mesorhizobium loti]OBQ73258.1 hypothetical protein A9K72_31730 [Mesorhizobium loti]
MSEWTAFDGRQILSFSFDESESDECVLYARFVDREPFGANDATAEFSATEYFALVLSGVPRSMSLEI